MRRPAIESTQPSRLPPAVAPPSAALAVPVVALLALAMVLAAPAGPAFAGAGGGGEPAARDPTTAELARRLDRETARLDEALAAATAAQRATEDLADQARFLAAGGLIVGLVGLVVAALAWGRQAPAPGGVAAEPAGSSSAPFGRPVAAPSGRPDPARLRPRSAQLPRRT
jgi:hypothetical protein